MKHAAAIALAMTWFSCGGSKTPPAAHVANEAPPHDVAPAPPPDVATTAATLKLPITGLEIAPDAVSNEPSQTDMGQMLGVRFMAGSSACVGLPTKIKGVYVPVTSPPDQLEGELVLAPGLTLDELTACYVAMGGKPSDVRSLGPATRAFPGVSLRDAFVDLG